jgi:hypothetical protein
MPRTVLRGVLARGAHFIGCDLSGARFPQISFSGIVFDGCDIRGMVIDAPHRAPPPPAFAGGCVVDRETRFPAWMRGSLPPALSARVAAGSVLRFSALWSSGSQGRMALFMLAWVPLALLFLILVFVPGLLLALLVDLVSPFVAGRLSRRFMVALLEPYLKLFDWIDRRLGTDAGDAFRNVRRLVEMWRRP